MKKLCILLAFVLMISAVSCTFSDVGLDIDGDRNDDVRFPAPAPLIHTVSFVSNGGTNVANMKIVTLETAPATTRVGHEFKGWYKDEALTVPVIYPLEITSDITLYASWLKISDTRNCENTSIKFMDNNKNSNCVWQITPPGFDLEALSREGYVIQIDVEYEVYYRKDYNVPFDVGYLGSPKYEAYVLNSDYTVVSKKDLTTASSSRTRTMTYTANASNFINTQIYLKFSTDNIQNIIYFKNIKVTYTCTKG